MWLINNENRHNIELPPLMGMSQQRELARQAHVAFTLIRPQSILQKLSLTNVFE